MILSLGILEQDKNYFIYKIACLSQVMLNHH